MSSDLKVTKSIQFIPGFINSILPVSFLLAFVSTPGGNRTHDLRLRRPLLYPTELLEHQAAAKLRKNTYYSGNFINFKGVINLSI